MRFRLALALALAVSPAAAQFNGLNGIYALNHMTFGVLPTPSVTSGGTGYAPGDTLTLSCSTIQAAFTTRPTVTVSAVSSGAITAVTLTDPGIATAIPSTGEAGGLNGVCTFDQFSSSGVGTGATLFGSFGFLGAGIGGGTSYPANTFYAAPNGAPGPNSNRSIVAADLPSTLTPSTIQAPSGILQLFAGAASQVQLGRNGALDWFVSGSAGAFLPQGNNNRDLGSTSNRIAHAYINDLDTPTAIVLTNGTGLPISTGVSGLGANVAIALGSALNGSGAISATTSPTFVTPILGTPTSATLTNATGLPIATGVSGLGANIATALASALQGSGAVVGATSPAITTPNVIGVTNASNAAAGSLGEYLSSTVLIGSAVSLTNATPANITSVSLTAGDWDCEGNVIFNNNASTNVVSEYAWLSTTSATIPTAPNSGAISSISNALGVVAGTSGFGDLITGRLRVNISSTTTLYLSTFSGFNVSTSAAYGFVGCRRMR